VQIHRDRVDERELVHIRIGRLEEKMSAKVIEHERRDSAVQAGVDDERDEYTESREAPQSAESRARDCGKSGKM